MRMPVTSPLLQPATLRGRRAGADREEVGCFGSRPVSDRAAATSPNLRPEAHLGGHQAPEAKRVLVAPGSVLEQQRAVAGGCSPPRHSAEERPRLAIPKAVMLRSISARRPADRSSRKPETARRSCRQEGTSCLSDDDSALPRSRLPATSRAGARDRAGPRDARHPAPAGAAMYRRPAGVVAYAAIAATRLRRSEPPSVAEDGCLVHAPAGRPSPVAGSARSRLSRCLLYTSPSPRD